MKDNNKSKDKNAKLKGKTSKLKAKKDMKSKNVKKKKDDKNKKKSSKKDKKTPSGTPLFGTNYSSSGRPRGKKKNLNLEEDEDIMD